MSIALKCFDFNPSGEPLTERHLQALWYDRDMRPPVLYDSEGTEIRVIDPGEWNLSNGPDFKNVTLEVGKGRRRVYGDAEIPVAYQRDEKSRRVLHPQYLVGR